MDLQKGIIETAQEIFSTMFMIDIEPAGQTTDKSSDLLDNITGMIGLAGTYKCVLAIHFPLKVARSMTASFLGMEESEVEEDIDDAIGEIANMLGGNIKSLLSENGRDIDLSLPSIVRGSRYTFHSKGSVERMIIPFASDVGNFLVEFQIES